MPRKSWSRWFFYSAIAQGALIFAVTVVLFLYGSEFMKPSPAMVIASGSAGTWLIVGYMVYILMILYLGVSSFFYHQIEEMKKKPGGIYNGLSLTHLILVNIGMIGTAFLLMYAGYVGGAALLPTAVGGGGLAGLQVHEQILGVYPLRVVAFIVVTMLGALSGGLSYMLALSRKR